MHKRSITLSKRQLDLNRITPRVTNYGRSRRYFYMNIVFFKIVFKKY